VVGRYSTNMSTVLALEPALLTNEEFLTGHPDLARFVKEHPEVAQHPDFYAAQLPRSTQRSQSAVEDIIESLAIFATFASIAFALAWLVRTIIEQKRWNRLTRTQSEVHTKILDRFSSSEELLSYIQTPAGSKFLESAPIPLHAERKIQTPPQARVIWSIQAGVVIAAGALGMLLVSLRFDRETGGDLFALGVIGFFIGAGFILSALVSLGLSRRLGVWQQPPVDDADLVK
jgi:small-conductance mechanosensitive channel